MAGQKNRASDPSRRSFLKNASLAVGGAVIGGGLIGGLLNTKSGKKEQADHHATMKEENPQALMFFTPEQYKICAAAAERIFPADANGPGGLELGCAIFIDHQLAGAYGSMSKEYMMGPFQKGTKTQGYQSRLVRSQVFALGLTALQVEAKKRHNAEFAKLGPEEQDTILKDFEEDKVAINGTSSKTFFKMLIATSIEGVYADPMYGGNKNMAGWKMKNFPGAQNSYYEVIEKDGLIKREPVSLKQHMMDSHM
jgi:gluconate 2-dehydrogenase gamma chain